MKLNREVLKKLLEAPGISGRESFVSNIIKENIKKYDLNLEYDNLGSIWGIKKSKNKDAKKLMIEAHMDEVGFMVTDISKKGFIYFEAFGGVWESSLNLTRLRVWTDDYKNSFSGVVVLPNSNSHQGKGENVEIQKMLLDIGARNEEEVKNWGIKKGSVITFDSKVEFNGSRVMSKSVDNRIGVSIIIQLMKFIQNKEFDFDIIIGCTTQEETGLTGARVSSFKYDVDIAMVIDVSPALDFNNPSEPKGILGKGTMLRHKDARTIYKKEVIQYLRKLMKNNKIKYQDYFSMGGTNAGNIHLAKNGITVIPIGLVSRNLHTSSSIFDIFDYCETLKLTKEILNDLNFDKINNLIKQH
ncbi:MAG: glutamyl aminopeptidase [Candidatus Tyloplasma litorale]|nr:MAG: glutamyl aminopeptidase [Mycoplasmatales bacterium]